MVNSSWKDLNVHGRRLNKILKILDKKFDKIPKDDIDGLARIAATIGNLTRQTVEVIKLVENIKEMDAWFSGLEKDTLAINKQRIRQLDKRNKEQKQEIQNQIEREKYEIHDEIVSKRHTQEMRI